MKIRKRGRHRNCGYTTIAEHDLIKKSTAGWHTIEWDGKDKELEIELTGRDNNSSYRYTVNLSVRDLAKIVSAMFSDDPNPALRAHAKGFSAFLEEAQRELKTA